MYSIKIDAAANTVPIAFDETAGSKVGTNLPASSRLDVQNHTSHRLAITVADLQSAPSSTGTNQLYVPPNGTITLDEFLISNRSVIYLRSDSGPAITSGIIIIQIWGRR